MERQQTFQFSDDELDTLESALAMYAAYTREMEVDMLVGDESDADEVCANHNRAKSMHRQFYEAAHEMPDEGGVVAVESLPWDNQSEWYDHGMP